MLRVLAFVGVLLAAAAVVGWWGVATNMIRMDSPFRSFDFRTYAVFSLIGETALGLPYAFGARALLKHLNRWSPATMWIVALAPGVLVTLLETYFDAKPAFGPCLLLAAAVIAAGWQAIGFDRAPRRVHG